MELTPYKQAKEPVAQSFIPKESQNSVIPNQTSTLLDCKVSTDQLAIQDHQKPLISMGLKESNQAIYLFFFCCIDQ